MPTLSDISEKTFVFFPLQVDPERNFQGGSPEYFYQLSAIISIARDLPAGVLLAVKEHLPAVGRRPPRFYDQIRELKNVVLLNAMESGVDIIREAAAVATINSTAGMEAAIMGKPVITFGRHNTYNVIPHVRVVENEADLSGYLREALSQDFDQIRAKQDGLRFLAALKNVSFDMHQFSIMNTTGYNQESLCSAYEKLMESIPTGTDVSRSAKGAASSN